MTNDLENKCLCCYKELKKNENGYHASCAFRLFGSKEAPILPYTRDNIDKLALEVLKSSTSVTIRANRQNKIKDKRFANLGRGN